MSTIVTKTKESLEVTLNKLLELQEINQTLDELVKEIEMLREQTSLEEKKYDTKKFQYNKNLPFLQKAEGEYNEIKKEIDEINGRIENCEEKKKKIKTIKEFKALNREIDFLSQQNAIKENELLNKSEEVDFKKQKIERILESLKEIEANFEEKKEELNALVETRKNTIKKQTTKKENVEGQIEPQLVNIFNRIYRNKAKLAVVPVVENVCQGCYTLTPRQVEVDLNEKDGLIFCPFCSRIVYLEQSEEGSKHISADDAK